MRKLFQAALVALMLVPSWGLAQDYDMAVAAYIAGDFEAAIKEWRPLAEQGNAKAQAGLGLVYDNGEGVPQDYLAAHMWFNIAGANGYEWGRDRRNAIAEKMTSADITEAKRRARVCMASNYTDCD